MKHLNLAFVGFGNVGRAFARLLLRKQEELKVAYDLVFQVTGIATARRGMAIDPAGLDVQKALALVESNQPLTVLNTAPSQATVLDFINVCPADVLFENSPVNAQSGQPAIDHLKAALERGMHAITANKGPVVHAYHELTRLAAGRARRFLFESTVLDGAPVFSLFRNTLPAAKLNGFHGILNSTSNLILCRMESGETFDQAVAYAQSIGIAETDPSGDVDGWDSAIKVAALATVLMDAPLKPQEVQREGIRGITPQMIAEAGKAGERWKLVCSARRVDGRVEAQVAPQRVAANSPLYSVEGTSSYVQFATDVLPGLGILESNPTPETTAYGLLADLINAFRETHG